MKMNCILSEINQSRMKPVAQRELYDYKINDQ